MTVYSIRPIRVEGNLAYVPLTQGFEAVIDAADASFAARYNWYADRQPDGSAYARRSGLGLNGKQAKAYMHQDFMPAPAGFEVDHVNGDKLDNRRCNLRVASISQNQMNRKNVGAASSRYRGVSWHKQRGKWHAHIKANKRDKHLGLFTCEAEAARAYDAAARMHHGEFATLNFPELGDHLKPAP